jgi:hypothetical protein
MNTSKFTGTQFLNMATDEPHPFGLIRAAAMASATSNSTLESRTKCPSQLAESRLPISSGP